MQNRPHNSNQGADRQRCSASAGGSERTERSDRTDANTGRVPTHALFHIEERAGEKSFWSEICAGWENADGSINLHTRAGALLLPGESYQLRVRKDREG